jgi:hypothetical protein
MLPCLLPFLAVLRRGLDSTRFASVLTSLIPSHLIPTLLTSPHLRLPCIKSYQIVRYEVLKVVWFTELCNQKSGWLIDCGFDGD